MGKLSALVVVLAVAASVQCLPLSKHGSFFITPFNVRTYASYMDNSITIYNTFIYFSTGSSGEKLLEVPLAGPGELDYNSVIKITFAFDPDEATRGVDHDIRIGITDGAYYNQFYVLDRSSTTTAPCRLISYTEEEDNRAAERNVPGQVTLVFQPFHKYGACYTAQDGGYVNVGTFSSQLDLSNKRVSLLINRDSSSETYRYYYFLIEFLNK